MSMSMRTTVSGVFQVCDDADFEEDTYTTFAVTNGTRSAVGSLLGAATGLAANMTYFVRASLTNNLDSVLVKAASSIGGNCSSLSIRSSTSMTTGS